MKIMKELPVLLETFFSDWLMNHKRVSPNTIAAYRDTFQLLLMYSAQHLKKQPSQLQLSDLNADFICDFLTELVKNRKISARTRNARLSGIKSFFHYIAFQEPGRSAFISRVLAIPESRVTQHQVHFLTEEELDALLGVQDLETWVGHRDHVMILVAAETGLRLSELISLKWQDVYITRTGGYIYCMGKGRKERCTPFSSSTAKVFRVWKNEMEAEPSSFVFPNNKGTAMSPDCFQKQLKKYGKLAAKRCDCLSNRKVTPHMLRHTTAMNFLQAGVDLSTIAIIMGHNSIETTQLYIEANLKLKEEALKKLIPKSTKLKHFKIDDKLVKYLKSL